MNHRRFDYLLIGGGMASAHCAAEGRKREAEGSILLVGREPDPPYERPPLSKEYMRGESKREDAFVHGADWYEQNDVELVSGAGVMSLGPGTRTWRCGGLSARRWGGTSTRSCGRTGSSW